MKARSFIRHSAPCIALAALCIVHSALCIAAEPPPAAAQEGVRLWEDGPFWADRNVGAEEPWEPGLYFWWGDAIGYRYADGGWAASDGSTNNFAFKSNPAIPWGKGATALLDEGWTTTNNVLAPAHDAASAHWGGDWRMPTKQELIDLGYNKCDWIPATSNGVKGAIVRGRGDYAGAAIFLPRDGWGNGAKLDRWNFLGHLWASDPRQDGMRCSWRLKYDSNGGVMFFHWDRFMGATVRPVRGTPGLCPGHGSEAGHERKKTEVKPAGPACAPEEIFAAASPGAPAAQKGVRLWEGGPLWADRNVGAEAPADRGWYFPWGDAIGYTNNPAGKCWSGADGSRQRFCFDADPKRTPTFGKDPDTLLRQGFTTAEGVLAPEHDAARANWGGAWRMPTRRELDGLVKNCDWTWTTNVVKGCVVRGRGDYASAAIFLPVSGWGNGIVLQGLGWLGFLGHLWAADPDADGPPTDCTWRLKFAQEGVRVDRYFDRYTASPVRPVRDEP